MDRECPRCHGRLPELNWGGHVPHGIEDCVRDMAIRLAALENPKPKMPKCPDCDAPMIKLGIGKYGCENTHGYDDD